MPILSNSESKTERIWSNTFISYKTVCKFCVYLSNITWAALQWHHYERHGVSNHQYFDCLLSCLFRGTSKKTSKLHVTAFVRRIHRQPMDSPLKGPATRKCFQLITSSWSWFPKWQAVCSIIITASLSAESTNDQWVPPANIAVTGLCAGNSPGPVNSPHRWPVTRKMFPFDDVIMKASDTTVELDLLVPSISSLNKTWMKWFIKRESSYETFV